MPAIDLAQSGVPTAMQFRVLGPDSGGPSTTDLRRLFRGQRLTAARRDRLLHGGRILALCGNRVVGLVAYERNDRDLRVGEVGLDPESPCGTVGIAAGLLDALELACMAGGARRLVLLPRTHLDTGLLRRRGYTMLADSAAGTWFEKRFV